MYINNIKLDDINSGIRLQYKERTLRIRELECTVANIMLRILADIDNPEVGVEYSTPNDKFKFIIVDIESIGYSNDVNIQCKLSGPIVINDIKSKFELNALLSLVESNDGYRYSSTSIYTGLNDAFEWLHEDKDINKINKFIEGYFDEYDKDKVFIDLKGIAKSECSIMIEDYIYRKE